MVAAGGLLQAEQAPSQTRFSVEGFLGTAFSAPSNLSVTGAGLTLSHDAHWSTGALKTPVYWSVRIGARRADYALELQLTHHKTYLENPPPEIGNFEITHGFNLLTLQAARRSGPIDLRLGAGVTIPHVSMQVSGESYANEGFEVGGPAFIAGVGKSVSITDGLFLQFEAQGTAARANLSVQEAHVDTWNFAIHLMAGVGYVF